MLWLNTICPGGHFHRADTYTRMEVEYTSLLSHGNSFALYLFYFILFSTFSGTHVRMYVRVATPLVKNMK